ncbi:MAG: cobalamin-binding protein [Alphaproteobacteria bacterium]|nr:cobalamin-binding protein [Alphaproteobacteria bacterium]
MASLPTPSLKPRPGGGFDSCADYEAFGYATRAAPRSGAHNPQETALARLVEGEIIPRLMMAQRAHRPRMPGGEAIGAATINPDSAESFAQLALAEDHLSLLAIVGELLQRGAPMEAIYLDLLAPAARRLGEYWTEDSASFADVTIALSRLHQVVRELSLHGPASEGDAHHGRSAYLMACPGEQHTFGLLIVEEFFRRAGWRTWSDPAATAEEAAEMVASRRFDVFGMTVSCDARLEQIAPLLILIRSASKNPDLHVLVGGRLFLERPDLVARVGADGAAADGAEAVLKAESAVRQLANRA